jgi:hypothetical protein
VNRLRTIGAFGALLIVLAACGPAASGGSSEPSSDTSSGASVTESVASQPSEAPTQTPDNGNGGDLAGILPDEIDGIALTYEFASGSGAIDAEGVTPEVQAALNRLGADVNDVSTAFAFGIDQSDPENPRFVTIFALRVAGADEGLLREEFRTAMGEDNVVTEANVGGKNVLAFGSDAATADGYLYAKGDIVFLVAGTPQELAALILSELP